MVYTFAMNTDQVIAALKKQQNGESLRTFAKRIGCSAAYLSDVFLGRRSPGKKIAAFLGLELKREWKVERIFTRRSK
jgi:lambda repressor-like predicted transcriptional regulator